LYQKKGRNYGGLLPGTRPFPMKTLLIIGGFHSLFFAVFHCLFGDKLHWKSQLAKLDNTNNAVMQILNLRIIFVFGFHAFLCFYFPNELLTSGLGKAVLLGSSLFWIGRTVEQFWFRKLEPITDPISIFLTVLFVLGSVLYLVPLYNGF